MASIKERQANKAASINLDDGLADTPPITRSEPRTAPGQLMNLQGKYAHALDENKALQVKLQEAAPSQLLIADLTEVPGRRRKLTKEQYRELYSNLQNNPLVTPVSVRKLATGGYEIVSGHNRVQIFKELGRDRILRAVIEATDDQADASAFFANLLHPDLPDFEKFLGFREIERRFPEMTRVEMASKVGVSASAITQIMTFGALSEKCFEMLREQPSLIGANAAQQFAKLIGQGRVHQVEEALQKVASGELDQSRAIKYAGADKAVTAGRKSPVLISIKSGKQRYCDVLQADKVLRIVFNSAEEASAAQEAVRQVLQSRAEAKENVSKR